MRRVHAAAVLATLAVSVVASSCSGLGVATVGPLTVPAGSAALAASQAPGPERSLRIAPDGREAGYSRDQFGEGWDPALGPGCDVRDVVLLRDLTDVTTRKGCDVVAGTLYDPYTGAVVTGRTRSLDVDHVVPLSLAWKTGAAHWTQAERERFANDPANLLAVVAAGPDGNRAKGDDGPERWLPRVDRCGYVTKFAALTARYELTVTEARQTAIEAACT